MSKIVTGIDPEKNRSTRQERLCTIVQTVRAKVSFSLSVI